MGCSLWKWIEAALAALLFSHALCLADRAPKYAFMKHATEAPLVSYYDYIIVGGGTAGCPLAATLSKNFRVLLLERGGAPYGNANISNLVHFADTLSDLAPGSPAQRFISEDGVINSRARVLGGGSCLNAGFYTRASPDYVHNVGWDGALVNRSYQWVERKVAHEPSLRQWQSAVRDGLLEVGVTPFNGFTYDHIVGTKVGGSIFDAEGNRHTAADLLEYAYPERTTVFLWATVQRILFRLRGRPRPLAHGVLFRDSAGKLHKAYLARGSRNEIIISAGAMGSPQLLMLSGIGPEDHLRSMGIQVLLDHPMVGKGMSDNPMNAVFVPSPRDVEVSLIQVVGITPFGSYIETASGANFVSFIQTGQLATVPPKQRTPEAIAGAMAAIDAQEQGSLRGGVILEKIMGPLSEGHLELRSLDAGDNPRVTFNYFQEPEDLRRCVEGMRTIERIIDSKAFAPFRYPDLSVEEMLGISAGFPINLRPRHDNDSTSLEQYCRDTVLTIWHYHGGCQVGRVVDGDYRVLGVDALRVVDGSTFNYSPGTNPQATVMMLGRYMGVRIQEQRLGTNVES